MNAKQFSPDALVTLLASMREARKEWIGFMETGRTPAGRLRVDVDFDLGLAVEMAALIHGAGLRATFFLRVAAPLYNLFSAEGRDAVSALRAYEQNIGLHFDVAASGLDRLETEFHLLGQIAPDADRLVAFHNFTGDFAVANEKVAAQGFVSAYAPAFFGPEIYVSDSNMRRTPSEISSFVSSSKAAAVQVLVHPVTWMMGGGSMDEAIEGLLHYKAGRMSEALQENDVWKKRMGSRK